MNRLYLLSAPLHGFRCWVIESSRYRAVTLADLDNHPALAEFDNISLRVEDMTDEHVGIWFEEDGLNPLSEYWKDNSTPRVVACSHKKEDHD